MRARRLPHRSTYILVFDGRGDLFIHLRTAGKDLYPSHWDTSAGGVPLAGEDFAAGAARELAEELGVQTPLDELFPFRWTDERTDVHGMVYRARHDGPFRLQPEEIVRGEFVPPRSVVERAHHDPFCPDGLAVLAEYQRRVA
jgi:isopentenyldiphosphate isomerase